MENTDGDRSDDECGGAHQMTLPTRRASVTLHRRVSESGEDRRPELNRRDSLEDTKSFYNVKSDPSSPKMSSLHSRRLSSFSRPLSSTSQDTSGMTDAQPRSPPKRSLPLHTPRAFLTPKKPAAALRMEQQAKLNKQPSPSSRSRSASISAPLNGDVKGPSDTSSIHRTHDTFPEPMSPDHTLASGPRDVAHITPSLTGNSLRQSLVDVSTPPQLPRELSSDHLVRTTPSGSEKLERPVHRVKSESNRKASGGKRNWEHLQTKYPLSTFFFGGRLMTGGDDPWSVLLTIIVMLGSFGVWLGTTGVWMWRHGTEYGLAAGGGIAVVIILAYIFSIVFSSFLAAALRDPGKLILGSLAANRLTHMSGIIPPNLDPDPPISQTDSWGEAESRTFVVNDGKVTVKYCETCRTYRPPRCSHCRLCGTCVDGIDHHCSYIHICVGKRNYLPFFTLLVSGTIGNIYIIVFSAVHFALLCHHDAISFAEALRQSPGAGVSFLLGVLIFPAVTFLLWYHLRLLIYNLTTVEQIRASTSNSFFAAYKRPDNPFDTKSLLSNMLIASLGRPQFPSWINPSGLAVDDRRKVNPALTHPKWARHGV